MGWNNPAVPWRELRRRMAWRDENEDGPDPSGPASSDPAAGPGPPRRLRPARPREALSQQDVIPWAELHCHSSFSFLDGAATPGELVTEAARLGLETLALTDHDGMYGVPQFAQAAARWRARGLRLGTVFGAELSLDLPSAQSGVPDPEGRHLLVLARDAEGYRRLCGVISAAQLAGAAKGRPVYDVDALAGAHGGHWVVLTGCRKGPVPAALAAGGPGAAWRELGRLTDMFGPENVMVELTCQHDPGDDERNDLLVRLADLADVDVVASGNAHFAVPAQGRLAQALAAIRARRSLTDMDGWLAAAGQAYLRSGAEMAALLRRYPGVLERTAALGRQCAFDFRVVAPRLPDCPVPVGHTEASWLRELVARKAPARYGPPGDERVPGAYAQIARELDVIERLDFPGYFLIVHELVEFCEDNNILCQGRGSAANSAVCYAIGITNVDPVSHHLLFERFLSDGRDGPPDIDLDIEHRRREEVIQHVYDTYGRQRAAQVANVITYRPRLALRDAGRALGYSPAQSDAWVSQIGPGPAAAGEPMPTEDVPPAAAELARQMQRLPRHLGIHSGGMVICDRPVGEVCPVEWARMPGRTVLQWDKDDCAYAGLVKFDLLGLGMLAALHDCFDLVAKHHGEYWTMSALPQEDPAVYRMLTEADTVGVFQVESRAQMATLPRLRPQQFYDLVIEVALIRPGSHPGRFGPPLPAPPRRAGGRGHAARVDAPGARQDPGRAAVPGADDAAGHRLRGLHARRGGPAAPGHERQAGSRADHRAAQPAAGRDGRTRHRPCDRGGHLHQDPGLLQLRVPRVARDQLRLPGLRQRLAEAVLPGRVHRRAAAQPADGLLRSAQPDQRRPAARGGDPRRGRERQRRPRHPGEPGPRKPPGGPPGPPGRRPG